MYGNTQNSMGLFSNLNRLSAQNITGDRYGGGRGGGSEVLQADPMETNRFVEMNLNPYLTDNVHSFHGGGVLGNVPNVGGVINTGNIPTGGLIGNTSNTGGLISNPMGGLMDLLGFGSGSGRPGPGVSSGGNTTPLTPFGSVGGVSSPAPEPSVAITNPGFGMLGGLGAPNIGTTTTTEDPSSGGFTGFAGPILGSAAGGTPTTPTSTNPNTPYPQQPTQSFAGGGSLDATKSYMTRKDTGERVDPYSNLMPAVAGAVQIGSYNQGANEMIAQRQLSNLMNRLNSPYTANQNPYMANKGMKYKYNTGGEFANQLGGLVTKLQKEMPDPQDAVNLISKLTNNQQPPMANKGMKMRKRYTQGGRF